MSELDTFETRFAEAYRRHLDRAPRPLDAAAVVRAVTAQPRGRSIAWPRAGWPLVLRPAQVLVWIVLTGLLIAALAVGIFVGSHRPAVAFACPAGSTPNTPGPIDQARPPHTNVITRLQEPTGWAFDRRAGKLVALVAAPGGVQTWTFEVCSNTWTRMHPAQEPSGLDGVSTPVYDVDSDVTIVVDANQPMNVWVYDLEGNAWAHHGVAPLDTLPVAYDLRSGLVVAANSFDPTQIWTYDVETDTWTPIHQANGPVNVQAFAYDVSVDRLVVYAGPIGSEVTWLLDIQTGTWSRSDAETPTVVQGMYGPMVVYDEAAERTVVMGAQTIAYDATADDWEILSPWPLFRSSMAYDPVNRRLVGLGWQETVLRADVLAFDLTTRERRVLLEAWSP